MIPSVILATEVPAEQLRVASVSLLAKRQITLFSMLPASKKSTPLPVDENIHHEGDLEEFDHSEQESEEARGSH